MHSKSFFGIKSFTAATLLALNQFSALGIPVNAHFTGGNSATQADGYLGMAGSGWLAAWKETTTGGSVFTNTVSAASPLQGGGNYLDINLSFTGTASSSYVGAVGRKFDPAVISHTAPYTLSFKVKPRTALLTGNDIISIFGDVATGYAWSTGAGNTFVITSNYNSGNPVWSVVDGDGVGGATSLLNTGMPLLVGSVYSFVVNVDPATRTWSVAIDNGATVYQSGVLGFRNAAPANGGNTVYFGAGVRNTTGTLGYSVDSLTVDSGTGTSPGSPLKVVTFGLAGHWKFSTDPTNIGNTSAGWYTDTFNDSSWQVLRSGSSWESQGINYAGYGWYRQRVTIPATSAGVPIRLNLISIDGDDDVWFNGVRIGGIKGNYKYANLLDRQYWIPASAIRYGQSNTIAIRTWGGSFGSLGMDSGLTAALSTDVSPYTAVLDPYMVMARDSGAPITAEKPIALYDLSTCQQGRAFDVVFRFPESVLSAGAVNLTYTLKDFYGATIQTATVPISLGSDGIVRGVANVFITSSQVIYLAGRFKATLALKNTGGSIVSTTNVDIDRLSFAQRDNLLLPALATTFENTPYGSLKLIDMIDCATPLATEVHPYMQSGYNHAQDYMTPGPVVSVPVTTILGKQAREPAFGWFAYRIGRGGLTPGKAYLLRIEYPEDKSRYCPIEVQSGHNYMDIGWKSGISPTDVYDPWPLSNTWQYYDVIVPVADESTGTGGAGDSNPQNGFWVYVMNKMKPGYYFKLHAGGPAVATMKLYEISPTANAPAMTLPPAGLPQRVLMFDWERQAEQVPRDLVNYAKLMGYSAISPIMLKWALANYGEPTDGYDSVNVDDAGYWVQKSGVPAPAAIAGMPTVHQQYLDATRTLGLGYIPRFEYGGSNTLPISARAINSAGATAAPSRFGPAWCANLLETDTYTDLKFLMDKLIEPYTATNPQLSGALWRIREDRMPISYSLNDIAKFSAETGTPIPASYTTQVQRAHWASNTAPEGNATVAAAYSTWWQGKRRDFHQQLVTLLKSYRSDLTLYYYNWDPDKFCLMKPDVNASAFYSLFTSSTNATNAYNNDRVARASFTEAQYINVMNTGDFSGSFGRNRPDYALRPSLYSGIPGIQLFAPANYLCYADKPAYLNYFQTADGLAVSNCVSYDEIGMRSINPKFECNMMLPGGGPFSMAMELLAYFHGDARTLTYTVYTYGRGFADAHRRFAQAFRALPAVPGTVVNMGTDADTKVRTYNTTNGTYVGVAYKGYTGSTFTVTVPGQAGKSVKNLVTGATVPSSSAGADLTFNLTSGPMELNAFLVGAGSAPVITSVGTTSGAVGSPFSYQIVASNSPTSYGAAGLPSGLSINSSTGAITGSPTAGGTSNVTLSATNASGIGTKPLTITIAPALAGITANFTAGNTTALADGYTGAAGSGWLGPWVATPGGGGTSAFSNSAVSTNPLSAGGSYLSANLTVITATPGAYTGAVGRKFDSTVVSTTAPHTVSCKVRLDTAMTSGSDALLIFGDIGTGFTWNTGPGNTWVVSGFYNGGNPVWSVFDGDRAGTATTRVVTTMPVTVGTVYTIVVNVVPATKSWTVTIDNGATQYQSPNLGFRNPATSGAGNTVYFGANVRDTTHAIGFSVDSVNITAP